MKHTTLIIAALLTLGVNSFCFDAEAQCRGWVKRNCLPEIEEEGFTFSGQMNTAVLNQGETADITITFNKGQTHRLMVCCQDILGEVVFKLMDKDKNVVYTSEGKEENYYDFKVESTQQLILEIVVPEGGNTHGIAHHGCVSIIQGYR